MLLKLPHCSGLGVRTELFFKQILLCEAGQGVSLHMNSWWSCYYLSNWVIANIWCLLREGFTGTYCCSQRWEHSCKKTSWEMPSTAEGLRLFVTYWEEKMKWSKRLFLSWIPSRCSPACYNCTELLRNIKLIPPLTFCLFFSVLHCCTLFYSVFSFHKDSVSAASVLI